MRKEKAIALLRDARKHREHARKLERIAHRQLGDERHDDHEARDSFSISATEEDHFGIDKILHSPQRKNEKPSHLRPLIEPDLKHGRKNAIVAGLHHAAAAIHRKGENSCSNHPDRGRMSKAKTKQFLKKWDHHSKGSYNHNKAARDHVDAAMTLLHEGAGHAYGATRSAVDAFAKNHSNKETLHTIHKAIKRLGPVSSEVHI